MHLKTQLVELASTLVLRTIILIEMKIMREEGRGYKRRERNETEKGKGMEEKD